jgi:hypothetical protein
MFLSSVPDWLKEPDVRTYQVDQYVMDYLIEGKHIQKNGYLLVLHRNGKIRQTHFFTNKREAEKLGKKYMKENNIRDN